MTGIGGAVHTLELGIVLTFFAQQLQKPVQFLISRVGNHGIADFHHFGFQTGDFGNFFLQIINHFVADAAEIDHHFRLVRDLVVGKTGIELSRRHRVAPLIFAIAVIPSGGKLHISLQKFINGVFFAPRRGGVPSLPTGGKFERQNTFLSDIHPASSPGIQHHSAFARQITQLDHRRGGMAADFFVGSKDGAHADIAVHIFANQLHHQHGIAQVVTGAATVKAVFFDIRLKLIFISGRHHVDVGVQKVIANLARFRGSIKGLAAVNNFGNIVNIAGIQKSLEQIVRTVDRLHII